jgi:ADP-ribosylglycohydrolase
MDPALLDRASGVLLGQACGDALGVPYEFGPALPPDFVPEMVGGGLGPFEPGEYSDDTAMAVCIAEVSATGIDLTSPDAIDRIAGNFLVWGEDAKDIGNQTSAVLAEARASAEPPGVSVPLAAQAYAFSHPHSAGNGALMRTAVVALSRVRDREATAAAARRVAAITHVDPLAVDSCVLWTEAVRRAVVDGELDLLGGLDLVAESRRTTWRDWIDEATATDPRTFSPNGFTVTAMQAAWAAITWTPVPDEPARHLELALMNAVRTGNDTDTVAAIAGGLLGARWGASAIPPHWAGAVHGYGGHTAEGLVDLAVRTLENGIDSPSS